MPATITDDLFQEELVRDPYEYFARLRVEDPVHWNELFQTWEITRHEDVAYVLRHPEHFTSDKFRGRGGAYPPIPLEDRLYAQRTGASARRTLINHDWPRHAAERNLVQDHFSPKASSSLRPIVRTAVNALIDRIAPDGEADLIATIAPLPINVFLRIMGLPAEDGPALQKLTDKLLAVHGPNLDRARTADEGRVAVESYLTPYIEQRLPAPTDDLLSALCDGERNGLWTREDLLANATLVLSGGYETTLHLLGNGTLSFLRHPDQWALLKEDPEGRVKDATEECLRYDSPVRSSTRIALRDFELRGKHIRERDRVRWWVISANRDETVFARADTFDITRTPNPHLTFGVGPHYCLGAGIARMEGQEVFAALAQRLPKLRLDASALDYHSSVSLRSLVRLPVSWS